MPRHLVICVLATLAWSSAALATGRTWILPINERQGNGWIEEQPVVNGPRGYAGTHEGRYWWAQGFDGVRRVYWKFAPPFAPTDPEILNTTEEPNPEPRLYHVELWRVGANTNAYNVVTVDPNGWINNHFVRYPYTPWNGQFNSNDQWIKSNTEASGPIDFVMGGNGPQTPLGIFDPETSTSLAACANVNGAMVWARRGSDLYVHFNQSFYNSSTRLAFSALRITELNALPANTCDPATYGGPVDLRCIGNTDPLYGLGKSAWWDTPNGEPFGNGPTKMLAAGDSTLGAEGWVLPCFSSFRQANDPTKIPVALSPGLPPDGNYVAQLGASGEIAFKLRYDGMNSIQWDAGEGNLLSPFYNARVFTLNQVAGREFVVGRYGTLYLLSVKSGGSNGRLNVTLHYEDATTEIVQPLLYDWFGTNGDATAMAVGVNGELRSSGAIGFRRIRGSGVESAGNFTDAQNADWIGYPGNGGDTNGAFLFVHPVPVNATKELVRVDLGVEADGRGFGGRINVIAASFGPPPCNTPAFDVVGAGPDGLEPDGSVDMNDFGVFQRCYTGTGLISESNMAECRCFDRDGNGAVDVGDFNRFVACSTGPASGVPAPIGCDAP